MADAALGAAQWVVGKALAPVADGVLEAWAASSHFGLNIEAVRTELLQVQAMLERAATKELSCALLAPCRSHSLFRTVAIRRFISSHHRRSHSRPWCSTSRLAAQLSSPPHLPAVQSPCTLSCHHGDGGSRIWTSRTTAAHHQQLAGTRQTAAASITGRPTPRVRVNCRCAEHPPSLHTIRGWPMRPLARHNGWWERH
ncbi:uncharacterized protein LOC123430540 [Hordeum vulgare subsp. vulgare]|uniref:uncharacterized protein LOC123430540 n=1 Tax=Hordeum vulgare subsp. vulgare TaxID=112509 RepID=UPI001D1A39DC|nr:uncharacterized protein LOC123430540 [Hordeum vulgare subsp. vulgare]